MTIAKNKKAYFDYFIEDEFEAGIVLTGTEIKAIRSNKVQIKESFIKIKNSEAFIHNLHIGIYEFGNLFNHEPTRMRKLLLHKKEISKIEKTINLQGYSIVPLSMYFKGSLVKMKIGIGKGKKNYDKRKLIKERDIKRDTNKYLKEINR